ncbi:hypothetical protein D7030_02135 [Flavobacteriaceae bacterium AU392]|nr:hypothetical protein D1817_08610 [Flavobacteriaceae bacterium]RKM85496.1 hypothetical protein D7030_02135 [Flavobacteriaceae bacterium AU392]
MQFKHPELLYTLFLLLIPIIVHLFQLRRFQKVDFTNVQFLKNVIIQTRKSSQLKKWLTLITRLLLLTTIIIAFAQPYFSKSNTKDTTIETVIYLDNSFSMQARGNKGELLKRAIQDLISTLDEKENISLFTNNNTFRNTTIGDIKNELLQLEYSSNQLEYNAVLLKGQQLFSKDVASIKNFILISDFQQKEEASIKIDNNQFLNVFFIKPRPVNVNNVSVDSVYISKVSPTTIDISAKLKISGNQNSNSLPISLFEEEKLIAKTSVTKEDNTASFSLPSNKTINAKISVEDISLQFDNTLYFNINEQEKINVLAINSNISSDFLKRVYTNDEFNYFSVSDNQLNYNDLAAQNLIILNELDNISVALVNSLKSFMLNGGNLLIIPSNNINLSSYNQLLKVNKLQGITTIEKKVTTINYSHPVFNNVFDKQVTNFQYPKVNSYYNMATNSGAILQFEDGKPFLSQDDRVFVFSSAINIENSNFINSPLIVPTLYNIGRQSLQLPNLYYTIGKENNFDINTIMQQDDILKLKANTTDIIIPQQQTFSTKVKVITNETPNIAEIYAVTNKAETLKYVSYNYNRDESNLNYLDVSQLENVDIRDSVPDLINDLKSDLNINALWKWFAIFALVFLIIEMLILKYFK